MMNNPWEDIVPPSSDYSARRIDPVHPFEFFWARDVEGSYLLLFKYDAEINFRKKIPPLSGIDISFTSPESEKQKNWFMLSLKEKKDVDIFYSLCCDLIKATEGCSDNRSVVTVITGRLNRWHVFLKKNRPRLMSEAVQKGLIGELIFLRDYIFPEYSVADSLSFWQGPLEGTQDFCIGNAAIEVKCQLGTTKPCVRISSVEQLTTQLQNIYLFVVTLGKGSEHNSDTINLPIIIDHIRSIIVEQQLSELDFFNDLLFQAGYLDLPEYADFHFILSNCSAFEVIDNFPKLSADIIPEGIINTSYDLVLDNCIPFKINTERLKSLGVENEY